MNNHASQTTIDTTTKMFADGELKYLVCSMMEVDLEEVDEAASLIDQGLDSVSVMRVAVVLKGKGYEVSLKELLAEPTLAAWTRLIQLSKPLAMDSQKAAKQHSVGGGQFPLTPVQQAYLVGRRDDQPLGGVGCHLYCEFDGEGVDPTRLEDAVIRLCAHHPMLRAKFFEDGYQQIMPDARWSHLVVRNFRHYHPAGCEKELLRIRDDLSHRQLDIFNGEVFDIGITLLPNDRTRIHLNIDLLIADVLSITILLRDLAILYDGGTLSPAPVFDFEAYLATQRDNRDKDHAAAARYWNDRLPELSAGPLLPAVGAAENINRPRFSRRAFRLSMNEIANLRQTAGKHGLTLATTLASAFSMILARWSESPRFLLNVPLFDRAEIDPAVANMIADFTNLMLVQIDAAEIEDFGGFARGVQARMHEDIAHSAYSGVEVLRDLRRVQAQSAAPIVFACNFADPLLTSLFENTLGYLGWSISQTPQVSLDHQIYQSSDGFLLNWDAVEALFPPGVLDAMFEAYEHLVHQLCAEPWENITPPRLPDTQAITRAQVNSTDSTTDTRLLHEPFLEQAQQRPEATALIWSEGQYSYGQLRDRATAFAEALALCGLAAGDHVAVMLSKGPDQIAAVLGILMAGGVYVPISPDSPPERLARILSDADCRYAFGVSDASKTNLLSDPVKWLVPTEIGEASHAGGDNAAWLNSQPENLAYIIYTSGSTGAPKGVMIDHRGALNTVLDINRRWSVSATDRILGLSSLAFDLSVYDVFGSLSAGAALVLPDEEGRRDPEHWHILATEKGVTLWNSVPALMTMAVDHAERRGVLLPSSLRLILLSGDWIPVTLPERIRRKSGPIQIIGLGGATEASIWSNWFEIGDVDPAWSSIPYGYPLTNQRYHVLDSAGRPSPDWVAGDLHIAGIGLAHGYWRDQEKTERSFVVRADDERLYRTGDRARYWPDGTLEFLGRRDHQVKIGGHRIELGEIDAALARLPGVARAVSDVRGLGDQKQIVAFVALESMASQSPLDADLTAFWGVPTENLDAAGLAVIRNIEGEMRRRLAQSLPSYMIPRVCVLLKAFPLTSNGKVDRARLPDPPHDFVVRSSSENSADLENRIVSLWEQTLHGTPIQANANFFDLGGDSLLAIRMVGELSRELGVEISVRRLYESPKLTDFVTLVAQLTTDGEEQALGRGECA